MAKPCALDCVYKGNCKRKRRVADPTGYCQYQTVFNLSKIIEIADRIVENNQTVKQP